MALSKPCLDGTIDTLLFISILLVSSVLKDSDFKLYDVARKEHEMRRQHERTT